MRKYKVTMICREIWRAEVTIESDNNDLEVIKDKAWAMFDVIKSCDLEQENFTKVEENGVDTRYPELLKDKP